MSVDVRYLSVEDLPDPPPSKTGWPWVVPQFSAMDMSDSLESLPVISIVTPSYNQGEFIEETIRSVLLQGYPNLEYFIIDGGSNDNTLRILEKYEKYVTFWVSEPDDGQVHAINKGFKLAQGEIVAWLNSDDVYSNGALREVGSLFQQNKAMDVLYGGCSFISQSGFEIQNYAPPAFDPQRLLLVNYISQPATFFRRKILLETGYLNENLDFAFDLELWLRARNAYSFHHCEKCLSKFRIHDSSKSVSNRLFMAREGAKTAVNFIEKSNQKNTETNLILRIRYLRLAVINWRIDSLNTSSIIENVKKANIRRVLFRDKTFLKSLIMAFLDIDPLELRTIERAKIKSYEVDIKEFYENYISPELRSMSGLYLNSLLGTFYSIVYSKNKEIYYYFRMVTNKFKFLLKAELISFKMMHLLGRVSRKSP